MMPLPVSVGIFMSDKRIGCPTRPMGRIKTALIMGIIQDSMVIGQYRETAGELMKRAIVPKIRLEAKSATDPGG